MTGLLIRGASGSIQVDTNYPCMSLITKGTVAMTSYTTYGNLSKAGASIAVGSLYNPLLAFSCAYPAALFTCFNNGSGTFTWEVVATSAAIGSNLSYWIFDRPSSANPPMTSTAGLKVFDPSGVLTYHSQVKPMRIAGGLGSSATTYSSATTIAVIQAQTGLHVQNVQVGAQHTHVVTFTGASISGNTATPGSVPFDSLTQTTTGATSPNYTQGASFLVTDVSGY